MRIAGAVHLPFFDLPLVTSNNISSQYKDKSSISYEIDPDLSKKLPFKILVAEDNKVNQKIAQRLFQHLGYEIEIVKNGLEVIETLKKQNYDVIFMDLQMPEMDGLEATNFILKEYSDKKCPYIIAMTANTMKAHKQQYLAIGMKDYISKPVKIEKIVTALYNIAVSD